MALDVGYRHIDTATAYGNEREAGAAVRDSGLGRQNVFITTKCPPGNAGREAQTIDASLKALGVDYADLWLVRWPPGGQARPDTWKAFVEALGQGVTCSAPCGSRTDVPGIREISWPWTVLSRYAGHRHSSQADRGSGH